MLPCDSHVHSEWSWDTGGPKSAAAGRMQQCCLRADKLGLQALAFTEHLDFTSWTVDPDDYLDDARRLIGPDSIIRPPLLDVEGYKTHIDRLRHRFPGLRILTGAELGQPHLERSGVSDFLDQAGLERVIGSLHNVPVDGCRYDIPNLFRMWSPDRVIREYLAEICRLIEGQGRFDVLTHIDFAARYWPEDEIGSFDPRPFEEDFRRAMRLLADTGRALEFNVGGVLRPWIPQWWSEEGGRLISFGSDAHVPSYVGRNFPEAAAIAEYFGFRPGPDPADLWSR